jgi:putative transposase
MTRQLRIECEYGLYHVTARGNARQFIFHDAQDWNYFLSCFSVAVDRHGWLCHSYCLMSNHYHLLIETPLPNLSKGMKYVNGRYAQYFNRRYKRVGHVFQGRFTGILVEKESYLMELCRYIVLNPVRAEMERTAHDWTWSSYRALAGLIDKPEWLTTDWLLGCFGSHLGEAQNYYKQFVAQGGGQPSPFKQLKNQIYLGSDKFVEDMQCKLNPEQSLKDIPRPQVSAVKKSLSFYELQGSSRKECMAQAYASGHYTLEEIANYFRVSTATVSRAMKWFECKM